MRYSKNDMALFCLSLLGLALAGLSGASEHVPWLGAWCASFSNGCRETAKFTLSSVPVWEWGAGFYAGLAITVLFARGLLVWLIPVGIGVEIALVAIMVQIGALCIYCLGNALVVVLLAVLFLRQPAFWQAVALAVLSFALSAVLIGRENRVIPWFCPAPPLAAENSPNIVRAPISLEGSQILGPGDAALTIVEYSDFRCPACRREHAVVNQAMKIYGNKVRWVFKNFPLQMHKDAEIAAEGALCAAGQNKFWEYQEALFTSEETFTPETLEAMAANLGLNAEAFRQCLESHASRKQVENEVIEGVRAGINAIPAFVINGKISTGTMPLKELQALIDQALAAKGTGPTP